ncbi:hypothetical protein LOK49_LG13G00500 [Camellia lanceoleosa]|uniref:Uncharacterized protein n=1 Tax=Camellia lanceoleosa TaxID=1840588 RepID=A0ACC0FN06_9ERIC|nr:hypothetical protein LOK49_LG13G00500 [Camellia lanceoleosa]
MLVCCKFGGLLVSCFQFVIYCFYYGFTIWMYLSILVSLPFQVLYTASKSIFFSSVFLPTHQLLVI